MSRHCAAAKVGPAAPSPASRQGKPPGRRASLTAIAAVKTSYDFLIASIMSGASLPGVRADGSGPKGSFRGPNEHQNPEVHQFARGGVTCDAKRAMPQL